MTAGDGPQPAAKAARTTERRLEAPHRRRGAGSRIVERAGRARLSRDVVAAGRAAAGSRGDRHRPALATVVPRLADQAPMVEPELRSRARPATRPPTRPRRGDARLHGLRPLPGRADATPVAARRRRSGVLVPDLDVDEVRRLWRRGARRRDDPRRRPCRQQRGGRRGDRRSRDADQRRRRRFVVPRALRVPPPAARSVGRDDHRVAEPARDLRGAAPPRDARAARRLGLSLGRHPGAAVRGMDGAAGRPGDPRGEDELAHPADHASDAGRTTRSTSRGPTRSMSPRRTRPSCSAPRRRWPTRWPPRSPRRRTSGTASSPSGRRHRTRPPTSSGGRPSCRPASPIPGRPRSSPDRVESRPPTPEPGSPRGLVARLPAAGATTHRARRAGRGRLVSHDTRSRRAGAPQPRVGSRPGWMRTAAGTKLARAAASDPRALERLVRLAYRHAARYYLEVARTPALSREDVRSRITIETVDVVEDAFTPGRPAIFVGPPLRCDRAAGAVSRLAGR